MQENLQKVLQQISQWVYKATEFILKWMHKALIALQRLWEWYQSLDLPEIPLSPLQWTMLFYVIFAATFLWATPIFEAGDELQHFAVIEHIRENGEYPVQDADNEDTLYKEAGSQAPLYYAIASVITSPFNLENANERRIPNPYANENRPASFGNKNIVLHPVDAPPLEGTALAVYILRVLNIAIGIGTIWAVFQIGQFIAPHRPVVGLVGAAFTAFNPMFIFVSASVSNMPLAIALSSIVIWLSLWTVRDGFALWRSIVIGVVLGFAVLTNMGAVTLLPVILVATLWVAQRNSSWQEFGILIVAALLGIAVIAGWWLNRNLTLYGDPFAYQVTASIIGERTEYTIGTFFSEFQDFRLSYWGIFGSSNIQATALFYALIDFAVFIAMFGVGFLVAQLVAIRDFSFARRELTNSLFLLGIVLVGGLTLLFWVTRVPVTREAGLDMFLFVAATSPLLAMGFVEVIWWMLFLLSPPDRSFVRAGEAVPDNVLRQAMRWPLRFVGFFAILIPFFTIAPQYDAPMPLDAIPNDSSIRNVYADYGDFELIGYKAIDRRYIPGDPVRMTFYWRVNEQSDTDTTLNLELKSPQGDRYGGLQTYPGAGTLRTTTWEEGKIYADTYEVNLLSQIDARHPFTVQVDWFDETPVEPFDIADRNGEDLRVVRLDIGAVVSTRFLIPNASFTDIETESVQDREFGGLFRLSQYSVTEPRTLEIVWQSQTTPLEDYTFFAHIVDENGQLVGQDDTFPELPTTYWRGTEEYITRHDFRIFENTLPEGIYEVRVGVYQNDGDELPRLLINEGNEERQTDFFTVLTFTVGENGVVRLPLPEFDPEDFEEGDEPLGNAPGPLPQPTGFVNEEIPMSTMEVREAEPTALSTEVLTEEAEASTAEPESDG